MPAFVQTSSIVSSSGVSAVEITLTGVGAAASLFALILRAGSGSRTYTTTDDKGNTWHEAVTDVSSGRQHEIEYSDNVAGGDTIITVTQSGGGSLGFNALVCEFSGLDSAGSLDVTSSFVESANSDNHFCGAVGEIDTAANVVCLAVGTLNSLSGVSGTNPGTNWTELGSSNTDIRQYRVSAAALTDERGEWHSVGIDRTGAGVIASFKAAGGGAQPITLTPAVETDTAQALALRKLVTLTPASETDAPGAPGLAVRKRITLSPALSSDVALPLSVRKRVTLTPAVETSVVVPLTKIKRVTLTPAGETDQVMALAFAGGGGVAAPTFVGLGYVAPSRKAHYTARGRKAHYEATGRKAHYTAREQ